VYFYSDEKIARSTLSSDTDIHMSGISCRHSDKLDIEICADAGGPVQQECHNGNEQNC
jgi:hypothetical protein